MSVPEEPVKQDTGPPQHPFKVYTMNADDTKNTFVGGSYDNISAVTIACAIWTSSQNYNPTTGFAVGVYDDTDTVIAFLGRRDEEVSP